MPDAPDPRQIDGLCDRFEEGWLSGLPEPLEVVLSAAPEDLRAGLFPELLRLEHEYRAKSGRPLTGEEARSRFGGLGPWVTAPIDAMFPPVARVTLDVIAGPAAGRKYPLGECGTFAVGKQPGLPISLPEDGFLSRVHCLFDVHPEHVRVADFKSKNGTFVNGQKVAEAELTDGDEVKAGSTVFRVRAPAAAPARTMTQTRVVPLSASVAAGLPVPPPPAAPPAVPGYQIGGQLGRGGMGVVYRGTHLATGETVAIKVFQPAGGPAPTAVGRFAREAEILGRLSHPHIVGLREAGNAAGSMYFVMEFVPGQSAGEIVNKEGPLDPDRVLGWADQLLEALAHAHEKGFVHRDVKPANLMVTGARGAENLKLADFGLARACDASGLSGLTVANTAGGTPAYMPPEQVTDLRSAGPPADQYSAAATLYYLLTGEPIFKWAGTPVDMFMRILSEEPAPRRPGAPDLPGPFGPVVRRALSRDPKDRFPSARAMRTALLGK